MNKNKIKDLPTDQRPYEKCEIFGPEYLADAELLAIIIRTGYLGKPSTEVAQDIINMGGSNGILGICHLDIKELLTIKGIGKVKAIQIKSIGELSKRISRSVMNNRRIFNNPKLIAQYYMDECRFKIREELKVIMLNSKSALLGDVNVSVGTVNSSLASPREIFLEALKYKAVSIILLHNHPSGDPSPSRMDIDCTKKIREAGELVGINLIDHIIIGDNKYISLREQGIII